MNTRANQVKKSNTAGTGIAASKKMAGALKLGLVAVVTAAGIVTYQYLSEKDSQTVSNPFEYEDNITIGLMPGVDRDAFLAEMQKNVNDSAIAFSINGNPVLVGSRINLLFENPTGNNKDLAVEIFDNETGDSLYKSKAIKEGSYLTNVNLEINPGAGRIPATVYITAYHTETHAMIGQAAVEIIIDAS